MLRIGPKARIQGIRPELAFAHMVLLGIMAKHGVVMMLTHALDGVHAHASIHYAGGADDLVFSGSYEITVKHQIYDEWKSSVGPDFDIIFEDPGGPNEHFHCEWQPKGAYK